MLINFQRLYKLLVFLIQPTKIFYRQLDIYKVIVSGITDGRVDKFLRSAEIVIGDVKYRNSEQ